MQRYNSFKMIHKALRAMLYDAALTLQQTDFADIVAAGNGLQKIESVLYLFEKHAYHEDTFILPAIERYQPQLVQEFEKEHVRDIQLGNRLKHLLNIFSAADSGEGRIVCGSAISKSFVEFMVFNLDHMAKEEIVINQALWNNYTDEQLMLLNYKLRSTIPSEEIAITSKWMLRGINNDEAITWLKEVKESAPAPVFEALWKIAEAELPESRLEVIRQEVLEPEVADYYV